MAFETLKSIGERRRIVVDLGGVGLPAAETCVVGIVGQGEGPFSSSFVTI